MQFNPQKGIEFPWNLYRLLGQSGITHLLALVGVEILGLGYAEKSVLICEGLGLKPRWPYLGLFSCWFGELKKLESLLFCELKNCDPREFCPNKRRMMREVRTTCEKDRNFCILLSGLLLYLGDLLYILSSSNLEFSPNLWLY